MFLWINKRIFDACFCMAGMIVGREKKRVTMGFMNEWKQNAIALDHKTIILQLFGWAIYYDFCVVVTKVNDESTDVEVGLQAEKTLLTNINVLLAKWNVGTSLISVTTVPWLHIQLKAGRLS